MPSNNLGEVYVTVNLDVATATLKKIRDETRPDVVRTRSYSRLFAEIHSVAQQALDQCQAEQSENARLRAAVESHQFGEELLAAESKAVSKHAVKVINENTRLREENARLRKELIEASRFRPLEEMPTVDMVYLGFDPASGKDTTETVRVELEPKKDETWRDRPPLM